METIDLPTLRENVGSISVYPDNVAHAGWVYKQSKYLKFWRKRWMVLLTNGTALTFESESYLAPKSDAAREAELRILTAAESPGASSGNLRKLSGIL